MIRIRLSRSGSKKRPFYYLSVADIRKPRDGRFIERLGYFNPLARGQETRLKVDLTRVDYWLNEGCKVSERVKTLLKAARKNALIEAEEAQKLAEEQEKAKLEAAEVTEATEATGESESSEAADGSDENTEQANSEDKD